MTWTLVVAESLPPSGRMGCACASDRRGCVYLFGGSNATSASLSDLWGVELGSLVHAPAPPRVTRSPSPPPARERTIYTPRKKKGTKRSKLTHSVSLSQLDPEGKKFFTEVLDNCHRSPRFLSFSDERHEFTTSPMLKVSKKHLENLTEQTGVTIPTDGEISESLPKLRHIKPTLPTPYSGVPELEDVLDQIGKPVVADLQQRVQNLHDDVAGITSVGSFVSLDEDVGADDEQEESPSRTYVPPVNQDQWGGSPSRYVPPRPAVVVPESSFPETQPTQQPSSDMNYAHQELLLARSAASSLANAEAWYREQGFDTSKLGGLCDEVAELIRKIASECEMFDGELLTTQ